MASIDLNIIQRGAASDFKWTAGPGRITAADLGNIGEQRTDNGGALNALPTPFARFFIFKEAFRRVLEEKNDTKGEEQHGEDADGDGRLLGLVGDDLLALGLHLLLQGIVAGDVFAGSHLTRTGLNLIEGFEHVAVFAQ